MKLEDCSIAGVKLISLDRHVDERGGFSRIWCKDTLLENGIGTEFVQCNISTNCRSGTLRGMHYQVSPAEEVKIVRCIRGSAFDVLLDLRSDSQTFGSWIGFDLNPEKAQALYIPEGIAHGFITTSDDTELLYLMSANYSPDHARGVRWNDPFFSVEWPTEVKIMSDRDRQFPDFSEAAAL